jgi:tRNA(fMet)-specific endonuclease VapC
LTPKYLLDTNTLSDLVRHPSGRIARQIAGVGEELVCTSIIVAAELRYGAAKRRSRTLNAQLETILGGMEILPFKPPADVIYGDVRAQLERVGTPIGPNDMLIAAQALALGLTVVTDNEREFSRVAGLSVENWLR